MRLADEIAAARARPWAWGVHDCATFAGRTARAILQGPCAWEARLGRHATELGGARVMRRDGVTDVAAWWDLDAPRIPVAMAMRGDVAAVRLDADGAPAADGTPALGVVEGSWLWVAAKPGGLVRAPMALAFAAWPVLAGG